MEIENIKQAFIDFVNQVIEQFSRTDTYLQLSLIVVVIACAYIISARLKLHVPGFSKVHKPEKGRVLQKLLSAIGALIFPVLTMLLLSLSVEMSKNLIGKSWLVSFALILTMLVTFNKIIENHVKNDVVVFVFRWVGLPLLLLHMFGILVPVIDILTSMSISIGNIELSVYGLLRVVLFGSLLFWLGRVSNQTGKEIIRRQPKLDLRTKEVATKLLEVMIFIVISMLLLQVMGINLTALAVFGGAVGVGLGFGLQSISSNFISGIIILLDRSISIDDYIELEDGRTGVVREMSLRSTTLETFDGKDIMVPNEKFITESFTNWTHNDQKQRYRVDFSVAYHSDIRKLVEIIKEVVASHEQVMSGDELPIEERPDCEIDSFGDSGINMFVEFWMHGIDDGKNRVGGDLLLMILEALQENGYEIPFPQREVRVVNENAFSK